MNIEMEALAWETPEEIDQALAKRLRKIRKRLRTLFDQVIYHSIEEVIHETKQ